jgi:mannosyltransferase OCH1-like enzyme
MLIPRLIVQIGVRPSNASPSWRVQNPAFAHTFLTDANCSQLVGRASASTQRAYAALLHGAQRADVCRLLAVLAHGGFYVDTDSHAFAPLAPVVPEDATFFMTEYGSFEFFGAVPGHPIVAAALRRAVRGVLHELRGCSLRGRCCRGSHLCVILITGPKPFFSAIVDASKRANCTNQRWVPSRAQCRGAEPAFQRLWKCNDTGARSPYRSEWCGVARHLDCRNSGRGAACGRRHYSHQTHFFRY